MPAATIPANDWSRYALRAPVMLVHAAGRAVPVTDWVPFVDWADGRTLLGGRRPTQADLDYHLTTLFPPVRPRGFLEIRYLDSVPDDVWPAVVFTLVTLLDDPVAAEIATEATESVATEWDRAARSGLADRRLHAAAVRCVRAAAERAPAELSDAMERLVDQVEQGRSPADDFSDRVVEHGIASAVIEAAGGAILSTRDLLARELTRARERTLRLVDFDDAELFRQYDPLMSPLVWDLAHIGWQEELWLLRGNDPGRPGMLEPQRRALLRRLPELAGQQGRPAAARRRPRLGPTVRPSETRRSTASTHCPKTATSSTSDSSSVTRISTTRPCCRR